MSTPSTLREKYTAEREKLYAIRESLQTAILELVSGESVTSYSIGQRSVTRTRADLKSMQDALAQLEHDFVVMAGGKKNILQFNIDFKNVLNIFNNIRMEKYT